MIRVGGVHWLKIGATYYLAEIELPDGRSVKGLVQNHPLMYGKMYIMFPNIIFFYVSYDIDRKRLVLNFTELTWIE